MRWEGGRGRFYRIEVSESLVEDTSKSLSVWPRDRAPFPCRRPETGGRVMWGGCSLPSKPNLSAHKNAPQAGLLLYKSNREVFLTFVFQKKIRQKIAFNLKIHAVYSDLSETETKSECVLCPQRVFAFAEPQNLQGLCTQKHTITWFFPPSSVKLKT